MIILKPWWWNRNRTCEKKSTCRHFSRLLSNTPSIFSDILVVADICLKELISNRPWCYSGFYQYESNLTRFPEQCFSYLSGIWRLLHHCSHMVYYSFPGKKTLLTWYSVLLIIFLILFLCPFVLFYDRISKFNVGFSQLTSLSLFYPWRNINHPSEKPLFDLTTWISVD